MRRLTDGRRCLRDLFQYMNQHYAQQGRSTSTIQKECGLRWRSLTGSDFQ